jgi:hypothetical protein
MATCVGTISPMRIVWAADGGAAFARSAHEYRAPTMLLQPRRERRHCKIK